MLASQKDNILSCASSARSGSKRKSASADRSAGRQGTTKLRRKRCSKDIETAMRTAGVQQDVEAEHGTGNDLQIGSLSKHRARMVVKVYSRTATKHLGSGGSGYKCLFVFNHPIEGPWMCLPTLFTFPAPVTGPALIVQPLLHSSSSSYPQYKWVVLDDAALQIQAAQHAISDHQHPSKCTKLFDFSTTFRYAVGYSWYPH